MKKFFILFTIILALNLSSCKEERERGYVIEEQEKEFFGTGTIKQIPDISKGIYKFEIENFSGEKEEDGVFEIYSKSFGVGNYIGKKVFVSGTTEKGYAGKRILLKNIKEIGQEKNQIIEFKNELGGYMISFDKKNYEGVKGGGNTKVLNQSGEVLLSINFSQIKKIEEKNISSEAKKEVKNIETEFIKKEKENGFEMSKNIIFGENEFLITIKANYPKNQTGEILENIKKDIQKMTDSFKFSGVDGLQDSSCGGSEIKFCPKGYYCEVFDPKDPDSFGKCKIISN